ncbi:TraR/DksA C4-type zinc finger protein [Cohnella sp. JJ-181]|uniref:TraR/DksA C4-type zinc finger protein n=1 Tax=Cohnella rhizoplanae TaxID=2974897 RepID=UPI0022FFB156|nr:TraR/DksA C4-type zinc finger protein [Cohnella sp. JJ-181]CAI6030280.1 RNA polymerase-binding transcription factor DksA [Cohnella sp. JJ-181]
MNGLNEKQLRHLKELLLAEKHDIDRHFLLDIGDGETSIMDDTGELSSYDNHPADLGTETFERERDAAIDDRYKERRADVERALAKMEDGTYGLCEISGEPIGYERLEALPAVRYSIAHAPAEAIADGDYRPVEEDVMTPPPSGAGEHRQRQAGRFDDADAWKTLEEYGNASDTRTTGTDTSADR